MKNMTVLERQASTSQSGDNFSPVRICEIEIGEPLPDISATNEQTGQQYRRAQCLIRFHTQPLGLLQLPLDESEANAGVYARHILQALGEKIKYPLREDGLPEGTTPRAYRLPRLPT